MSKGRVIVAMSGGVDSSVAALLLKCQGYEVIGVTMRLWSVENDDLPPLSKRCCSAEDVDDARRVCQVIGVRHYVQNFEREFKHHVIDNFVREYEQGRTPHPCLACNDKIKFDFLLRRALFLDADYIATGHYGRIRRNGEGLKLLKGADGGKDQSYVLYTLKQAELRRLLMPVGEYPKADIRHMAQEAGLPVAQKPDSQEICFIPSGNYREFVSQRSRSVPGDFVDTRGSAIGTHPGIQFFTVGQRRGLGLSGSSNTARYVVRIEPDTNRVVLGTEDELYSVNLWASDVNFISGDIPGVPLEVDAKIRYNATVSPATVTTLDNGARVKFSEPQRAVTPGQPVVFYDGPQLLGGGTIEPNPSA